MQNPRQNLSQLISSALVGSGRAERNGIWEATLTLRLFPPPYTVIHLLVVDVACVLFLTQSVCMVPNQNTPNIYHKQMNNGVSLRRRT